MASSAHYSRRAFLWSLAIAFNRYASAAPLGKTSRYEQAVLAKKPVGYWRLGEQSGAVAADLSGSKADGAFQGTPKLGQPGALKGDPDLAAGFDGSASFVEIPDSPAFSPGASGKGLTVEVWLRPDVLVFPGESAEAYVHWLGKGEAGAFEWGFRMYSRTSSRPNRISAYLWNPDGGLGTGAYFEDALKPGEWMHIAACFDPGDKTNPKAGVSIFKNGVLRGGPATSSGALYKTYNIAPTHGSAPLRLGTRDRKSFLTGALDEVAIYPRVLRPFEIAQNYRAGV